MDAAFAGLGASVGGCGVLDQESFEQRYELELSRSTSASSAGSRSDDEACGGYDSGDDCGMPCSMFRGRDTEKGKRVVLRHPYVEAGEAFPEDAVRELSILKGLSHPSIVHLEATHVVAYEPLFQPRLWMVFEDFRSDLRHHLKCHGPLSGSHLASSVHQCLEGIAYCHEHGLFHRDLRPENLLVNDRSGTIKISGVAHAAKCFAQQQHYNCFREQLRDSVAPDAQPAAGSESQQLPILPSEVPALWYQAPESLLVRLLGYAVNQRQPPALTSFQGPWCDMWSLACVVYEMATGEPLFPGRTEMDTLCRLLGLLGSPGQEVLGALRNFLGEPADRLHDVVLAHIVKEHFQGSAELFRQTLRGAIHRDVARRLEDKGAAYGPVGASFMGQMLRYESLSRPTARNLLRHPFFYAVRCEPEIWTAACLATRSGLPSLRACIADRPQRRLKGQQRRPGEVSVSRVFHARLLEMLGMKP
eukprot:TRINITY_DN28278_c0_g1_i1.p1 TRINITY_DN28278_c0_g1~~TRINITY_DN28278_c0_g1_i1.p1  ORF type:complete len:474 (+),score=73.50 TRINITY_DN28278_c0_g1_i1:144-1565(+)